LIDGAFNLRKKQMKILALYFSQSGQLKDILLNIVKPLGAFDIDIVEILPETPYPFPWTSHKFFDVMPETVLEAPIKLKEITFKHNNYDLILLCYQPWFLSPSPPITSLLKSAILNDLIYQKPVITIIGARNMWINSQKSISTLIKERGGYLVANIPLSDKHNNLISAVTILYWMLTGKKERMMKIFPKPGISTVAIEGSREYGVLIKKSIEANSFQSLQASIVNANKINISTEILFIEKRAKKLFLVWANSIAKAGKSSKFKRSLLVETYKYYLLVALFVVAPIVLILYKAIILPFTYKAVVREKHKIYHNMH